MLCRFHGNHEYLIIILLTNVIVLLQSLWLHITEFVVTFLLIHLYMNDEIKKIAICLRYISLQMCEIIVAQILRLLQYVLCTLLHAHWKDSATYIHPI